MYIQNYYTAKLSYNYASDLRHKLYSLILAQSFDSNNLDNSSELITNLTDDTEKIKEIIFSIVSELLPSSIMVICTLFYAFWINFNLSLLILVLVPLISLIINFFTQLIKEKSELTQDSISNIFSVINQNFSNFLIIKTKGWENKKLTEYIDFENKYKNNGLKVINYISMQPSIINMVQVTGICIIASYGAYQVFSDKISMSELLSFGTALSLTIEPSIFITKSLGIIEKSKVSYKNINHKINLLEKEQEIYGENQLINNLTIEFKDICFNYEKNNFKLNHLNLKINQGEIVAIKGDNGSGKSTVIKLILRHLDNYSGLLKIGNNDIKSYTKKSLRENISASFHDPLLFNTSIKENIIFGYENTDNLNQTLDKIIQITKIDEFLNDLENGLNYIVSDKGNNLSTGQKQRISIARAIIKQPNILILDEATSALDLESEKFIYQEIRKFLTNSTIIIINHRKESIEFVDTEIFL